MTRLNKSLKIVTLRNLKEPQNHHLNSKTRVEEKRVKMERAQNPVIREEMEAVGNKIKDSRGRDLLRGRVNSLSICPHHKLLPDSTIRRLSRASSE